MDWGFTYLFRAQAIELTIEIHTFFQKQKSSSQYLRCAPIGKVVAMGRDPKTGQRGISYRSCEFGSSLRVRRENRHFNVFSICDDFFAYMCQILIMLTCFSISLYIY